MTNTPNSPEGDDPVADNPLGDDVDASEPVPSTDPIIPTDATDELDDLTEAATGAATGAADPVDDLSDLLDPEDPASDPHGFESGDAGTGPDADTGAEADAADTDAGATDREPAMPPPPQPMPVRRRLVRDPYSRLGGVASGVAQYYGIDVSIVRILFVLLAFGSGFGFFAYLLAWLIIPRADHWPPGGAPVGSTRSLSRRDIGIGLAAVGVLTVLAFGAGSTGSVLVPLVLVTGGVWLLLQPNNETAPAFAVPGAVAGMGPAPVATAPAGPGTAAFGSTSIGDAPAGGAGSFGGGGGTYPPSSAYLVTPPGPPVPPRSRRRGILIGLVLVLMTLFIVIPVIAVTAAAVAIANGDFREDPVEFVVDDPADLPISFEADGAEVTIDLRDLTVEDFDDVEDGVGEIDVDLTAGSVEILLPDDLPVSVDAETNVVGSVSVFNSSSDGIDAGPIVFDDDDAVVDIDVNVGFGEIDVRR
ncbi:MAG: PspC domain-containing protein [Actinomycetota bacterium]